MTKQPTGLPYEDATPQQIAAAKAIIADAASHRYYVSRIYAMFNLITGKREEPQTCSSCLRTRAVAIKKWYDEGQKQPSTKPAKPKATNKGSKATAATQDEPKGDDQAKTPAVTGKAVEGSAVDQAKTPAVTDQAVEGSDADVDPNTGLAAPASGVMRIPMEDGTYVDFLPNDGAKFENGVKGMATAADTGKKVKAGTFKTAQGHDLKVQIGGKSTYVETNADDDLAS